MGNMAIGYMVFWATVIMGYSMFNTFSNHKGGFGVLAMTVIVFGPLLFFAGAFAGIGLVIYGLKSIGVISL